MALSGRIFGFGSLSMLIPQVLEGDAAVALLYAGVRRWFGAGAGLLAVGTMIGFAFLAKMMQAFLVLPAFGLVYLTAAPTGLRRRLLQLGAGGLAIVLSAGWWVATVGLWPVGSRPMIDGSPTNNIFNLITGYNGLGRIFGANGPGGGGGGSNFSGPTGVLRLFNDLMGGQAAWLLPAALLALLLGLWTIGQAARTDRTRAALLLWGGWLFVSGVVFSLGSGVIHTDYTVALAPAIAALVAIGARMLRRTRQATIAKAIMAFAVLLTGSWAWVLLDRPPQWNPGLRVLIIVSTALAVTSLLAAPVRQRFGRRVAVPTVVLAAVACLAAPIAYSAQTISTNHTGSIPSAGPSSATGRGPGGNDGGGGAGAGPGPRPVQREQRPCQSTRSRQHPLQLGRGRVGITERRLARARHRRRTGDGHRRLRQPRRESHPGPVQALRRAREDPLLHRLE